MTEPTMSYNQEDSTAGVAGNLGVDVSAAEVPAASGHRRKRWVGLGAVTLALCGLIFVGFLVSKELRKLEAHEASRVDRRQTEARLRSYGISTPTLELAPPRTDLVPLTVYGVALGLIALGGLYLMRAPGGKTGSARAPWGRRLIGVVLVPVGVRAAMHGVQVVIDGRHENELLQGTGAAALGGVFILYGLSLVLTRPRTSDPSPTTGDAP